MRTYLFLAGALGAFCLAGEGLRHPAAGPDRKAEPHRSPIDLAVLPGGQRVLTANHTADSVSLVDLVAGKVLAERPCGQKPVAVACSPDGKRAAVSNLWSGTLTLLAVEGPALTVTGRVAVGAFPRGLVFAPDGRSLYAAVAGVDAVVQLDWDSRTITRRLPAPREPRQLALSADGRWLAAASSRSAQVRCWDLQTGKLHWERKVEDSFNLRGLAFTPDSQELVCAHVVRREFPVTRENIDKGWVIDNRLTRFPLKPDVPIPLWQISLDKRGQAVGDPHGAAFGGGGRWLAVTASGTHELLLLEAASVPWSGGDPGDVLDVRLAQGDGKFRRVPLGGRPLAIQFLEGGEQAAVANYLLDAVQVVDARAGKLQRTIPLGGPAEPSLARRGEALFYDARLSHNQWFSCHTCHVDGHTCHLNFDTLNDDSFGNAKLTPTLRGVAHTGPWTWHGWQKDLGAAVEKSLTETMYGPKPSAEQVKAMVAFLGTLGHPPNPNVGPGGAAGEATRRGRALFEGKAKCARCHHGENYTSESNYDVKLEPDGSPYLRWNPPSLRGLFDRGPFLHDGRARTLEEVLDPEHHGPEKLGGQALTPAELQDLVAFLKSL
jgi:cytochrome c peroxidase